MITIDKTCTVGIDLYTVATMHQEALSNLIIREQIPIWKANPFFLSASVHKSIDGLRVFTYSQWKPMYNYMELPVPIGFKEFFPAERHILEVFTSRSLLEVVGIVAGDCITHLAEFRMLPVNQPEMMKRASSEINVAMNTPGLLSASFHRSVDGTRVFNYGQWESVEAFEAILKIEGFNPDKPYWDNLARNEFSLYKVIYTQENNTK